IAADNMGNSKEVTVNLNVDNSEPVIFVNSPVNNTVLSGPSAVSVRVTVQDASSIDTVLLLYYTGSDWISMEMTPSGSYFEATTPVFPIDTQMLFHIFANDTLGNSDWSQTYTCNIVDLTEPLVDIETTPSFWVVSNTVQIDVSVIDDSPISIVIIYIDGTPMAWLSSAPYSWSWDTSFYTDGSHTVRAWANDTWDNSNYSEVSFETDNSNPVIIINSPTNNTIFDAPARVSIESSVGDFHDLSHVLVFYTTGSIWVSEPMVLSGSIYIWNSSVLSSGTTLRFYVFANDTLGNGDASSIYECQVNDLSGPIINTPTRLPIAPTSFDSVIVSAIITDHSSVGTAILSYLVDSGFWTNITMNLNSVYWASIPAMATGSVVSYRIYSSDTLDQWASTPVYEYTVVPFDMLPPTIHDSSWTPLVPDESQSIDVFVNATDPSGVINAILSYHDGVIWHNITMIFSSGIYTAQIPPQVYGTDVNLRVYTSDGQGNWGITPIGSFTVVSDDLDGPVLDQLSWSPLTPTEEDTVEVYAELSDVNGIYSAILCYGYGTMFSNVTMTFNLSGYVAVIGTKPIGYQMNLRIFSCDNRGNWAVSDWSIYTVQASDVIAPVITDIEWLPLVPYANETIYVNATVSDENHIDLVLLCYYDGVHWRNLTMTLMSSNPNRFVCHIPAIGSARTIQIWILAQDAKGNWGFTDHMDIDVQPEPVPTTTPETTTPTFPTTIPTGNEPPESLMVLVFGGAGWAVVVILLVYLIRKKK
ncbi:MAG: Ig-like domain-containing protein, partial [Candidatus Thorarchaeota archaeon]